MPYLKKKKKKPLAFTVKKKKTLGLWYGMGVVFRHERGGGKKKHVHQEFSGGGPYGKRKKGKSPFSSKKGRGETNHRFLPCHSNCGGGRGDEPASRDEKKKKKNVPSQKKKRKKRKPLLRPMPTSGNRGAKRRKLGGKKPTH